ncbi:MAG: HAD-IIIA family hydrolase [Phycisphaeraceae bacterium]|nr:HAD-IIIA family hydrolase [Phycisphaeraceae bacterium]
MSDASRIRLLCLDVDGVLTDGGISIDDQGHETKRFHVHDGAGLRLWRKLGLEVAVITGRSGMALRHRLEELGIRLVEGGAADKVSVFRRILGELNLDASQAAMVGDDLPDLPLLRLCGYPVSVPDAAAEVREVARYITRRAGGHGAVRDAIEHLLREMGRWQEALALHDSGAHGG